MVEYTEENILVRPIPFKILRQIHLSEDGSYAVQMDLKAGINQEKASEIIELLESIDLIYKIEGTDPSFTTLTTLNLRNYLMNFGEKSLVRALICRFILALSWNIMLKSF